MIFMFFFLALVGFTRAEVNYTYINEMYYMSEITLVYIFFYDF